MLRTTFLLWSRSALPTLAATLAKLPTAATHVKTASVFASHTLVFFMSTSITLYIASRSVTLSPSCIIV
jgi:hypothetical protein